MKLTPTLTINITSPSTQNNDVLNKFTCDRTRTIPTQKKNSWTLGTPSSNYNHFENYTENLFNTYMKFAEEVA